MSVVVTGQCDAAMSVVTVTVTWSLATVRLVRVTLSGAMSVSVVVTGQSDAAMSVVTVVTQSGQSDAMSVVVRVTRRCQWSPSR